MSLHGGTLAHWEAIQDAARRLHHDPIRHAVGVLVMGLMLSLPGVAWMALRGLDVILPVDAISPGISVFLVEETDEDRLGAFADTAGGLDGVLGVEVIPRTQGLDSLAKIAGLGDLALAFEDNPLPDVVRLVIAPELPTEAVSRLALNLESDPNVQFVRVDEGLSREMRNALVLGKRLVFVLGVMVVFAIILVVTGATRIEVTRARAEIALVDLVGGTQTYARRPFVYMGILQGLAGGLLAALFVYVGGFLIGAPLERLLVLYGEAGQVVYASLQDLITPLILGVILGGLGARLAARIPSMSWN